MNTKLSKEHPGDESSREIQAQDAYLTVEKVKDNVAIALIEGKIKISEEEILEVLKEKVVRFRVTLLRHYPYNESTEENRQNISDYNALLRQKFKGEVVDDKKLSELEKIVDKLSYTSFDEIPDNVKAIIKNTFNDLGKTLLIYPIRGKQRVKNTGRDLLRRYKVKSKKNIRLTGSNKESPLGHIYIDMCAQFKEEYIRIIEKYKDKSFENIVIIGNRTYSYGLNFLTGNGDITIRESEKNFEEDGYIYHDYGLDGKLLAKNADYLSITPEDYQTLQKLFPIEHDSVIDFQNKINTYFKLNKTVYKIHLTHPTSPIALRTFCLANLLKTKDIEDKAILQGYLHTFKISKTPLPLELLEIFLKEDKHRTLTKEALLINTLYGGNLGELDSLCKACKCPDLYSEVNILVEILNTSNVCAQDIFSNSLDSLIKQDKPALIYRGLHRFERKPQAEIERIIKEKGGVSRNDEYNKVSINLGSILSSSVSSFVLLGHVGDGKSTELARMKNTIDTNSKYMDIIPLFYSAKTHNTYDCIAKITEDIKTVYETFPDKKIVVFFDGMDELDVILRAQVTDFLNKKINTDYEENKQIQVIMGSRASGFDELSESSIHFDGINDDDKNNFLLSRLRSLRVVENDILLKLEEIKKFLATNILAEDLKNTPLILFFLCKLAVDEKLEAIKNRSSLYEEVIKKIIIEHNISKGYTHTDEYIDEDLDKLSAIAFDIFSNHSISLSDKRAQKLAILFKQVGKKEYGFIHKSFEEFFLARYLAKYSNGVMNIYKKRDDSMIGNWNDWREFRPVVMFYGEMLAKNIKGDELVKFLGEEGLLKNDDIFSRNFFMGLEIIYRLPEDIKKQENIQLILRKYEKKVENWGLKEMIEHFGEIEIFMRNTQNIDINIIKKIWREILQGNIQDTYLTSLISLTFGTEGVLKTIEGACEMFTYRNFHLAGEIYIALAKKGIPEAINGAIEGARMLFYAEEFQDAGGIYSVLIKNGCSEVVDEAIECAEKLYNEDNIYYAGEIYTALAGSNIPEAINGAVGGMQKLSNNGDSCETEHIYSAIVKNNSPEAINALNQWISPIVMVNEIDKVISMASMLTETTTPGSIQKTMEYGLSLLNEGKNRHAKFVYITLANKNKLETTNCALEGAKMLFDRKKFNDAGDIYRVLIKKGVYEAILGTQECIKELFIMGQIPDVGRICATLAEYNIPEATNIALEGAKMLFDRKKYSIACEAYLALFKSGNTETTDDLKKCIKLLINKQRAYNEGAKIQKILLTLAEYNIPEATNIALEGAKMLFDRNEFKKAGEIYLALKGLGISGAKICAHQLYIDNRNKDSLFIYSELFRLPIRINGNSMN